MILENKDAKDTLALLAQGIAVEMHAHHAVQLVVSLKDSYPATLSGEKISEVRGFLIDSDVPHACQSENSTLLIISVDAETDKGRRLRQILNGKNFRLIEEIIPVGIIANFARSYLKKSENNFDYLLLIKHLTKNSESLAEPDERVERAIEFIARNIETKFRIAQIAEKVNLSESRLRHVFREKTGISLSSYILWTRIKVALKEMLQSGTSLSDAAYLAGFADHAHFTRIFRRMFGVPPSLLVSRVEFLQIFDL